MSHHNKHNNNDSNTFFCVQLYKILLTVLIVINLSKFWFELNDPNKDSEAAT